MTADATKPHPFHGKLWLKEHEEKLEEMVQEKKSWADISYTLGRTPGACKDRLAKIRNGTSKPKQPVSGTLLLPTSNIHQKQPKEVSTANTLSTQREETSIKTETEPRILWSAADELLLVQLRAIKMPCKDIVDLLSVRRSPGSISSYYNALKMKNMGFLDDYYKKIGHPYASTSNSGRKSSTVITTMDDGHDDNKAETNEQVQDIVNGIENLRLKHLLENEPYQQPTPSVGLCHYCHRSATTFELHQPVCLHCKSVLAHYTPDTLRQLAQSINSSPKNHIPINEKDQDYIIDTEYKSYMKINIPKRMQGGIEIERPRASHGAFLNIASINGLIDVYTNIQGHWTLQQDAWDHLKFAYFKTEQGQVRLKPALSIIAHLANFSTEEDIKDWISALASK